MVFLREMEIPDHVGTYTYRYPQISSPTYTQVSIYIKTDKHTCVWYTFIHIHTHTCSEKPFFFFFWLHWIFVAFRELFCVIVLRFLISVASLVAEHGL